MLLFQLLPLFLALFIHQWKPALAKKLTRPFELLTNILVITMMSYGLWSQFDRIKELSLATIAGMLLLFIISLALGWYSGGKEIASKKATAFTAAIRNTGIGMIIAIDNFSGTVTVMVVILWGLIMTVLALLTIIPFKWMNHNA